MDDYYHDNGNASPSQQPKKPPQSSASLHSLPIELNASGYMLPPSTSYGVPVAPVINVYPDKLEYDKSNHQPPSPPSPTLYNILHDLQSFGHVSAKSTAAPNTVGSHLHFAEPLPDYYPTEDKTPPFEPSTHTHTSIHIDHDDAVIAPIQFHVFDHDGTSEADAAANDADDQYDDINNDDYRPAHSVHSKSSFGPPTYTVHRPQQPHKQYRSNAIVDRFLATQSAATKTHAKGAAAAAGSHSHAGSPPPTQRAHTLDTDDLRDAFVGDFSRFRLRAQVPAQRSPFGQRIPKQKGVVVDVATTTTEPVAVDTTAATTPGAADEAATSSILVLLSARNNDSRPLSPVPVMKAAGDATVATALPLRADSQRTKKREPTATSAKAFPPRQNSTRMATLRRRRLKSAAQAPAAELQLTTNFTADAAGSTTTKPILQRIFDEPNVEILSIEQSRSHSFYAGTMAPEMVTT